MKNRVFLKGFGRRRVNLGNAIKIIEISSYKAYLW